MNNISLYFLILLLTKGVFSETISASVKEGDSVTLNPGLIEIKKDDVIDWRFGGTLIARVRTNNIPSVYDDALGGAFKGRLQLNGQTGDLTITNLKTTDTGDYEVANIFNTIKKTISLSVSSSVVSAGALQSVSVKEGDSVTLNPGFTEIKKENVIDWRFGGTLIARVRPNNNPSVYDDALGGTFKGRLQLNPQTGDLNITNIKTTDAGDYEVANIFNTIKKTISLSVVSAGELQSVSVMEGDSVTLHTDFTEIQTDDEIQWRFEQNSPVAEINKKTGNISIYDGPDERFKDRLKLDQTGSLTITDTRTTDSGLYKLEISGSRKHAIHKSFTLTVSDKMKSVSVKKGDSVTLHTDLTEVPEDDVIQWRHGDTCVAEINKAVKQPSTCDGDAAGFKDRLKLDQTGSLTITDITNTDSGLYEVTISSSRRTIHQRFSVAVIVMFFVMREGQRVILTIDTEIQRDDEILWKFGDEVIPVDGFNRGVDSRWRNIDVHDNQYLIINSIQKDQFGDYNVEIKNKSGMKKFQYKVIDPTVDDLRLYQKGN